MYSRLAAEYPGAILDVGCGTGRVMLHLAREGRRVHGIDNDRAMLDRLDAKLEQVPWLRDLVTYIRADILDYQPEQSFSLILLTYNAMMHFHDQGAQITLLSRLRACLAAGGRLVIDLPNAGPAFAAEDSDALTVERSFLDRETGHLVMLQSLNYLDRAEQMLTVEWIYDEIDGSGVVKRLIAPHKLRYFFLPELCLLLERCGFEFRAVYGEPDGSPYDADSERMIVHAAGRLITRFFAPGPGDAGACYELLLLFALLPALTNCRYLRVAEPAPAPTATAMPRQDPLPTIEVLDSEALYGNDSRAIGGTSPGLASLAPGAILPPAPDGQSDRGVSLVVDAETTLPGELYSPDGPRLPGILLLGSDIAGWGALPAELSQNSFAVLVVQIEPLTPAHQVEALLQSFIAAPGVDAGSIGVIGADRAADIAALGCAVNSLCDALALLSPRSRDTLVNMMVSYGDRPIWLAARPG